jgi:hypothetical protein
VLLFRFGRESHLSPDHLSANQLRVGKEWLGYGSMTWLVIAFGQTGKRAWSGKRNTTTNFEKGLSE